jgi:hypothetical protein
MTNVTLFNSRRAPDDEEAVRRQEEVRMLYDALSGGIDGLRNVPVFLRSCMEREVWKHERVFAGGKRQEPISFHEFVCRPYPLGLGASDDVIRGFITQDVELLARYDEASRRPSGPPIGSTNAAQQPEERLTVDNIHGYANQDAKPFEPAPDVPPQRPTGTSAQAALRRLEKAVREGNEHAAVQQQNVIAGRVSPHRAAINMGWRKDPTPIEVAMRAWRRMTPEERQEFLAWAIPK